MGPSYFWEGLTPPDPPYFAHMHHDAEFVPVGHITYIVLVQTLNHAQSMQSCV